MSSTFGGIELGRSALNAFRLGMQTVGHNISNMDTEGYSRQRVNYVTAVPEDIPNVGQLGNGMIVSSIERIRDEFLDFQFRDVQSTLGYWEKINDLYETIQNYISEPNSSGIRSAMDTFFTSMQAMQEKPEDTSARQALVTSANSLGSMLGNLVSSFNTYNESINLEIKQSVDDANGMLHNIAALNKEIYEAETLGQNANDLRDKRDVIIDKLSKMMDISYNEPYESNGVKGEFFLSVNGKVLVQGINVRELKAHAFMWDNQVYYDVQVAENEFDIVDDPSIAEALATGAEGSYQLSVDRTANGVEWTVGGGNAHCLETYAVKTSEFNGGVILTEGSSDISRKLQFRVLDTDNNPSVLTVKIDKTSDGWKLRAEKNGNPELDSDGNVVSESVTGDLTAAKLVEFINKKAEATSTKVGVTATLDGNSIIFTAKASNSPVELTDYSGMLGLLTEAKREMTGVNMRVEPASVDDPLNISGSFRIQVGTQGTRVTSYNFGGNTGKNLEQGDILGPIAEGDTTSTRKHTFRIGVSGDQVDITASWNASTEKWILSSDLANSKEVGEKLTVEDLTDFLEETFSKARDTDTPSLAKMKVTAGKTSTGKETQFYIESGENHLLSISDVEGNLAEIMGMVNTSPVITIDVENSDSLVTIRNKINEKYQAEFGLTAPEHWVHASVDNGYLEISANVAGEAQRITLMGGEDGNMQVLRRLGLTQNQPVDTDIQIGTDDDGKPIYATTFREVAYIPPTGVSNDASFSLNGVHYLSSDNMFNMARRVPATSGDIHSRYKATELTEVNPGMWLNLKSTGTTTIRVIHHIRDGSIKGLEEARDGIIPGLKASIDEMTYGLAKHVNAYQYSGYGVSSDLNTTGVAFFNSLAFKAGAAKNLSVTDRVSYDPSLIGAAMGSKNADGKAVYGKSGGAGDGTNAARMVNLNFDKVLENGTMTISGIYDAMLSQIGTEAGHAKLMYTTEATVSDQINSQRQACSGVNLDEELMDIVILNRAFGAMSRYITAFDEMLNTIINGMGLVGR
ncbi:MAG: flagellar hook-associated protein FlgK [Synergistaceae bacterium]|nr:flagellar hook-associated protein FlgK [Synergistaceae bacterium]